MNSPDARGTLDMAICAWQRCVPAGFRVVGALADELLPIPAADRALVARAVPCRRAEFVAGRWCAYQALQAISVPAAALPVDRLGAPCWPTGAVGSITHDAGYCAAVAGLATTVAGIGIDWCDGTRQGALPELVEQLVADAERMALAGAPSPARHLHRLFCAKEAAVKAASAAVGQFLDLRDIVIEEGSEYDDACLFTARIAGQAFVIHGRLLPIQAHLLAMAWLPA